MTLFQAAMLGLLQGLTEFLPVSSSGHLIFVPVLFGWPDQGLAFDVVVHLGTLLAVIMYFRQKIWQLIIKERLFAWFVILSIIPAGAVGYFLETNSRSANIVAFSLIFWGIILGIADWYAKKRVRTKKQMTDLQSLKLWQVIAIAFSQVLALIPGTSRSGITISAGLFSGLSKKAAAEFSFLMSIPIIALAGFVKLLEMIEQGSGTITVEPLLVGFLTAGISGFIAIWGLMKIIQRWSFQPFMWYRIVVGLLILFFI